MAQDAELKLKVSLDLGFFRQQLAGLGQAAAGYNIPVQVKLDRRSVQNELNALGTNIRRRNYFLEVKTNLSKEIDNAKKLADALRALESGKGIASVSSASGTFRQRLEKVDLATIRNIYAAAAKAGLLKFSEETNKNKSKLITALNKTAIDASGGFLKAFQKENSRVRKAAGDYGDNLLEGLKKSLKISSPSWEMKKLGEYAADGFEIGLTKGLQEAQNSAVNQMRAMIAALKGEASKFAPALTMAFAGGGGKGMREALLMASGMAGLMRPETYGQRMTRQGRESIAARYGASPATSYLGGEAPFRYNMGGGPAIAGLLGPAGTTGGGIISRQSYLAQRQLQAQLRSAARAQQVLREDRMAAVVSGQVPLGGGGPILPPGGPPSGPGGGGGLGGFGQFGRAMGGVNLPGTGTVRELGSEFAFAAKQVLLFGTAYKALAFIQTFPGQVGQAVGQLQSFRNTLNTISPSAEEAAASNRLILDLVDKYNVPLQSARDGFTKLYASMAPAGFAGNEIRDLFTGISKAAATFGMSADKVDRVNYAFAQMASKGQVMSEELKGQLGDVLPGAMAIFAEAAGFKGPKAIQDFSAALEQGTYKGEAMRVLLKNVGVVMNKEFGPGAEGAAKTFQGLINRMDNSMKLLYESFEPIAVGFLNSVVVPLTAGIKQVSDGFNAFFSGTKAKTTGGFAFAQELEKLRPTFDGIRSNLSSLIPQLAQFGQIALNTAKVLLQIAGNPVVGYLAKLYLVALPLNILFTGLTGIIGRVVIAMTTLNVGLLAGSQKFMTYRLAMQAFGVSAAQVSTTIRTLAPALNLATIALRALAAPAVLFGISLLIERFMMLQGAIDGVTQSTKGMLGNISGLANAGAVKDLKNVGRDLQRQISTFESLRPFVSGAGGAGFPQQRLTKQGAAKMQELGLGSFVGTDILGTPYVKDFVNASKIIEERLKGLRKTSESVQEKLPLAIQISKDMERQVQPQVTAMPDGGEAEKGKTQSLESYENLADQLAKARNEGEMERAKILFEYKKRLLDMQNAYEVSGANEIQQARLKLAKELSDAYIQYEEKVFEAGQNIQRAAGSVAPGNRPPALKGTGSNALGLVPVGVAGARPAGQNALGTPIGAQVGGLPIRPVSGSERRDVVAAAQAEQAGLTETVRLNRELLLLKQNIALIIKQNFDEIYPVAQLTLENQLLAQRNALQAQGFSNEYIAAEQAIFLAREKGAAKLAELKDKHDKAIPVFQKYQALEKQGAVLTKTQSDEYIKARLAIDTYTEALPDATKRLNDFTDAQRNALKLQREGVKSNLMGAIKRATPLGGAGFAAGFIGDAATKYEETIAAGGSKEEAQRFAELQTQLTLLETRNSAIKQSIYGIGDAFGTAMTQGIASIAQGTATAEQVFAQFLESIAQALLQAAAQMIATYIAIGIARIFAMGGGGGGGYAQGNVSTDAFTSGGIPGLSNTASVGGSSFGGFTGGSFGVGTFANGGIVSSPTFFKFADGGQMNMGLMGEAGPEAIMPLTRGPDGRLGIEANGLAEAFVASRSALTNRSVTGPTESLFDTNRSVMGQSASLMREREVERVLTSGASSSEIKYSRVGTGDLPFVTESDMLQASRLAAQEGARLGQQRTLAALKNNPGTRRTVGI